MALENLEEVSEEEREYWEAMSHKKYKVAIQLEKSAVFEQGMKIGRTQGIYEGCVRGIEEGRAKGIEEGRAEGIEESLTRNIEEGQVEAQQGIALNMLQKGLEVSLISEVIGLSSAEIKQLENKQSLRTTTQVNYLSQDAEVRMALKNLGEVSEEDREYMAALARDRYYLDYGLERKKKEWLDKGIEKGLAQGIEKGRAKGMERGCANGRLEGFAQGIYEGRVRGMKKGIEEGQREIALNMLHKGIEVSLISEMTGLSVIEIKQLKK